MQRAGAGSVEHNYHHSHHPLLSVSLIGGGAACATSGPVPIGPSFFSSPFTTSNGSSSSSSASAGTFAPQLHSLQAQRCISTDSAEALWASNQTAAPNEPAPSATGDRSAPVQGNTLDLGAKRSRESQEASAGAASAPWSALRGKGVRDVGDVPAGKRRRAEG